MLGKSSRSKRNGRISRIRLTVQVSECPSATLPDNQALLIEVALVVSSRPENSRVIPVYQHILIDHVADLTGDAEKREGSVILTRLYSRMLHVAKLLELLGGASAVLVYGLLRWYHG
jgi:hypothetical protein